MEEIRTGGTPGLPGRTLTPTLSRREREKEILSQREREWLRDSSDSIGEGNSLSE